MTENIVYKFGYINEQRNFIFTFNTIYMYVGMTLKDLLTQLVKYNIMHEYHGDLFYYDYDKRQVSLGRLVLFRVKLCKRLVEGFEFYATDVINLVSEYYGEHLKAMCAYSIGNYSISYNQGVLCINKIESIPEYFEKFSLRSLPSLAKMEKGELNTYDDEVMALAIKLERQLECKQKFNSKMLNYYRKTREESREYAVQKLCEITVEVDKLAEKRDKYIKKYNYLRKKIESMTQDYIVFDDKKPVLVTAMNKTKKVVVTKKRWVEKVEYEPDTDAGDLSLKVGGNLESYFISRGYPLPDNRGAGIREKSRDLVEETYKENEYIIDEVFKKYEALFNEIDSYYNGVVNCNNSLCEYDKQAEKYRQMLK